jgi:hypothetical protein
MDQSAREKFFERIEAAPLAARAFFESVAEHFWRQFNVLFWFIHTIFAEITLSPVWKPWLKTPQANAYNSVNMPRSTDELVL